jgi:hypothetical protein
MTDKKHQYQSDIMALPPLKMVLGEVPEPDPDDDKRRPYRAFSEAKSEAEARSLVTKLIGHLKNHDK